jgi:hypothetical protein
MGYVDAVLITRSAQHACLFGHDEAERARQRGNDAIDWGADYRAKDDDAIDCDANRRRTINSVTIDDGEPSRYDSSYDGGGSTSSSSHDRRRDHPTNNCRDSSAHHSSGSTSSPPDHRGRDSPPHDGRSTSSPPDYSGSDRPPRRLDGHPGCRDRKASSRYGDPRCRDGAPRRRRHQDRPSHDGRPSSRAAHHGCALDDCPSWDRPSHDRCGYGSSHDGRSASGTTDNGSALDYGTRRNSTSHDRCWYGPSYDGCPSGRSPHDDSAVNHRPRRHCTPHDGCRDGTPHNHGARRNYSPHDGCTRDRDASHRCTPHHHGDGSSHDDTPPGRGTPRCDEHGKRHGEWQQRQRHGDAGRFLAPARRQPQRSRQRGRPEHIRCGLFLCSP